MADLNATGTIVGVLSRTWSGLISTLSTIRGSFNSQPGTPTVFKKHEPCGYWWKDSTVPPVVLRTIVDALPPESSPESDMDFETYYTYKYNITGLRNIDGTSFDVSLSPDIDRALLLTNWGAFDEVECRIWNCSSIPSLNKRHTIFNLQDIFSGGIVLNGSYTGVFNSSQGGRLGIKVPA